MNRCFGYSVQKVGIVILVQVPLEPILLSQFIFGKQRFNNKTKELSSLPEANKMIDNKYLPEGVFTAHKPVSKW